MLNQIQIDTSSHCGSKCWFCPVRYIERPNNNSLSDDLFEIIIKQLNPLKEAGIADPNLTIWLAAYGDILLDPRLEQRLHILRQHNFKVPIVSNGIGLSSKYLLLDNYKDVVGNFSINLPAGNKTDYSEYTLNKPQLFDKIIEGIISLYNQDPEHYSQTIRVNINGAYTHDACGRNQLIYPLPDGDTEKQLKQLKRLLPTQIKVGDARPLCDRAGLLREYAINNAALPNRKNWNLPVDAEKAKGCNGGDRLNSWLHITSSGNIVGCCQDYMETITFGNIRVNSLEQLWFSYERQLMIEHMLRTLCVKCQFSY